MRPAIGARLPRAHVLRHEVRRARCAGRRAARSPRSSRSAPPARSSCRADGAVELRQRPVHERLLPGEDLAEVAVARRRGRRRSAPPRATTSTGTSAAPAGARRRGASRGRAACGSGSRTRPAVVAAVARAGTARGRRRSRSRARSRAPLRALHATSSPLCCVAYGRSSGGGREASARELGVLRRGLVAAARVDVPRLRVAPPRGRRAPRSTGLPSASMTSASTGLYSGFGVASTRRAEALRRVARRVVSVEPPGLHEHGVLVEEPSASPSSACPDAAARRGRRRPSRPG